MPSTLAPLIAATGPYGLVGRVLIEKCSALVPLDIDPPPPSLLGSRLATGVPTVDITNATAVERVLRLALKNAEGRPMVVVHLAAKTDTKGTDAAEYEKVNVQGTRNVLDAAASVGAGFIHISTDYVFAGESGPGPFAESARPTVVPPGAYAASKFHAENLVLAAAKPKCAVARIAFPYGNLHSDRGLEQKMAQRFAKARTEKQAVSLFNDQVICPSYIPDVIRGILALANRLASPTPGQDEARVFHFVGEPTTPYAFGLLVQQAFGFEDVAVTTSTVKGTSYAAKLHLPTDDTCRILGWSATSHETALRAAALR